MASTLTSTPLPFSRTSQEEQLRSMPTSAKFGSPHIFTSDALPTNTAIGPASFDDSNVTLLPPSGVVTGSNTLTSLKLSLSGDFNNNGAVGADDYVFWRKNFNGDQAKYTAWRANFAASLT